ncbi:hypothetical protein B0A48_10891 [Cryoendolithus antarcticus]|uniref:Uncharacterized protein n=1 Tax=Cryoendolithus antarcticus TaxID=1507870 RepID=A0A1V8SYY3_9PEZI|nr:hypothetical protein B0A48_10891 [Cryoendolithus antarcticus]
MDPLSLCANIITVLQAANDVLHICYDYRAVLKDRPWSLTRVYDEVLELRAILEQLELLASDLSDADQRTNNSITLLCLADPSPLSTCARELQHLQDLLAPSKLSGRAGTHRHAVIESLGWRLKDSEAKTCLTRLEKCKTTLMLALTADQTALLVNLRETAQKIHVKVSSVASNVNRLQDGAEGAKRQKMLKWLSRSDQVEEHKQILASHVTGTSSWFVKSDQFLDIVHKCQPGGFRLTGRPGAGKTQLFAAVVEALRRRSDSVDVAYFYCNFRKGEQCDAAVVLGSLTAQLCVGQAAMPDELQLAFEESNNTEQKRKPELSMLKSVLHTLGERSVLVLLVDALDECADSAVLADALRAISSQACVFVTGRDSVDHARILHVFSRLRLETYCAEMNTDIELYVKHRLDQDRGLVSLDTTVKQEVAVSLGQRSAGMFRWAQCQLDSICQLQTVRQIRVALESLPAGLNETYGLILRRVPRTSSRVVRRVLLWLCFSIQPLSLDEVHEAIAIEPGTDSIDSDDRLIRPEAILQLCSSLVVTSDDGQLSLAHLSVKDYLLSEAVTADEETTVYSMHEYACHEELAELCLTYVSFSDFASGPSESALDFGLYNAASNLVDEGAELDVPGSRFGGTALHGATFRGHVEIMEMLLKAGADANKADHQRITPLHSAAVLDDASIIGMLLRYGALSEVKDCGGETPLDWAAHAGQSTLLRLLTVRNDISSTKDAPRLDIPPTTKTRAPVQIWSRPKSYFPSLYEKRSGMESSIIVSVEFGSPPLSPADTWSLVTYDSFDKNSIESGSE